MTQGERALREGVALIRPLPRVVYRLSGERPLAYLHDVLAQDVLDLSPGRGALAVALSPNGRVSAEVRVLPLDDGGVLLDAEPEAQAGIEERIGLHAGLAGCVLEQASLAVAAVRGPRVDEAFASAGLPQPAQEEAAFVGSGPLVVVRVVWGLPGVDVIASAAELHRATDSLAALPATWDELEVARIEAGRPRFGPDISEEFLVNETPLLVHALSLTKGCYPGQESVAKVHNLGSVRRSIRSLRSDSVLMPAADIAVNGSVVGRVTSAATLPDGSGVAIAVVRSEIEPGSGVDAGGVRAILSAIT